MKFLDKMLFHSSEMDFGKKSILIYGKGDSDGYSRKVFLAKFLKIEKELFRMSLT